MNIILLPIVVWIINFLLTVKISIPAPLRPATSPSATIGTSVPVRKIVTPVDDGQPWGVAKQLDEHTWKIKVAQEPVMATADEIFRALNNYRVSRGSSALTWDSKLADYAVSRSKYFNKVKNLDGHKGFVDFMNNQDGFNNCIELPECF